MNDSALLMVYAQPEICNQPPIGHESDQRVVAIAAVVSGVIAFGCALYLLAPARDHS